MSTYDDFVETLPMRRKAKRLAAIAEGVALAVQANNGLRLQMDSSYTPEPLTVYIVWLGDAIHAIFRDPQAAERVAEGLRARTDEFEFVFVSRDQVM